MKPLSSVQQSCRIVIIKTWQPLLTAGITLLTARIALLAATIALLTATVTLLTALLNPSHLTKSLIGFRIWRAVAKYSTTCTPGGSQG